MTIEFWILLALTLGAGAWGVHRFRLQKKQMQKLKQSLMEINQHTHEQETVYTEEKARWEQTEKKLRSFLQLMDTVMNTIPNPIYFKDAKGVYQGCNKVFRQKNIRPDPGPHRGQTAPGTARSDPGRSGLQPACVKNSR
jgi:hypothetical protein